MTSWGLVWDLLKHALTIWRHEEPGTSTHHDTARAGQAPSVWNPCGAGNTPGCLPTSQTSSLSDFRKPLHRPSFLAVHKHIVPNVSQFEPSPHDGLYMRHMLTTVLSGECGGWQSTRWNSTRIPLGNSVVESHWGVPGASLICKQTRQC